MPSINYMEDETVKDYFRQWASSPTTHAMDREKFYKFVKACLRVDKELDIEYLKLALYDSFHTKYNAGYDEFVNKYVVLFEQLRDFENTTFP